MARIKCGNCHLTHGSVTEVHDCYGQSFDDAAQQEAETYAEAVMSWVAGGGSPADASRYATVIARGETWDGGVSAYEFSGQLCEHQLAVELCEGPQHYPMDDYRD